MSTRFDRIQSLFVAALEKPAAEREMFLNDACAGESDLRGEIQQLLDAHLDGNGPLDRAAVATIDMPAIVEKPGTQIGPYKLREKIGEGGFGVVFVAQQTKPVRRKVALKIIKPGMDTKDVIARFEAERQALALMDHPNVAKVLDAGATDTGRPFFVMELVKGVPITSFCDEHKLSTDERLKLFGDVCRAVQHAHQKGIIHRDLKPSNVMVTLHDDKPVVKVIDFGVSKALSRQLTDNSVYTAYDQMIGTPLYMSPEQAQLSGLDVDTRSDVYSLGVLLYELLTGTTPFDKQTLTQAGFDEMRRIIREDEPPRPSARVSTLNAEVLSTVSGKRKVDPRKLGQSYRGELDWIVMKALEKDRNRRYESASAFAADVERYLADEPVQACPPSVWYRFGKLLRRKKAAVATTAFVVLFVLTIAGGFGWILRDRDARQKRVAGQVELVLDDVDRLIDERKWHEALTTARRAESLIEGGDADAQTRDRVRDVLRDLELLDRLEIARLIEGQTVEGKWNRIAAERAYAQAFRDAGLEVDGLSVPDAAAKLQSRERIAPVLATALTEWARLRKLNVKAGNKSSDDRGWRHLLAVADAVDPDPWRQRLRKLLATPGEVRSKEMLRKMAEQADVRRLPPSSIWLLGIMLREQVSPDAAVPLLEKAQRLHPGEFLINFDLAHCLSESTPKRLDEAAMFYHVALAIRPRQSYVLNNLAAVRIDQGRTDDAIARFKEAIKADSKYPQPHYNLGILFSRQGKLDDAITSFLEANRINSQYPGLQFQLGGVLFRKARINEAIASFQKAIAIDPTHAQAHYNLGVLWQKRGKREEAAGCYRKTIQHDPNHAKAHVNLSILLGAKGKPDDALRLYKRAVELSPKLPEAHHNLGYHLLKNRKFREAIASLRTAIKYAPDNAKSYYWMGRAHYELGERKEAISSYRAAIKRDGKHAGAYNSLGIALYYKGDLIDAVASYKSTIKIDPRNYFAHYNLGRALLNLKKFDEALAFFQKAAELNKRRAAPLLQIGNIHNRRREFEKATVSCERALKREPANVHALTNLGGILCNRGKLNSAIVYLKKAVTLDPRFAIAQDNLGQLYVKQRKFDLAIACCRKAIAVDPKFSSAHNTLGNALYHQQKFALAIASYRNAIKFDRKNAFAYNGLGNALRDSGKLNAALAAFENAIRIDRHYLTPHLLIAGVLKRQGNETGALSAYNQLIKKAPKYGLAHNNLAVLYSEARDKSVHNPKLGLNHARLAVKLAPAVWQFWSTLSAVAFRNGHWKESLQARQEVLKRVRARNKDRLFLAMTHWHLGRKPKAHQFYDDAVTQLTRGIKPSPVERTLFREAAQLLGRALPPALVASKRSKPVEAPKPAKN